MNRREAYEIVFNDMCERAKLWNGIYDGKNGNKDFMFGIANVMEDIAWQVSEETYNEFSEQFTRNMIESEKKAGVINEGNNN